MRGVEVLEFGVNLAHKFYSGNWLEPPNFAALPENIKELSQGLCGVNLFIKEPQFPTGWIRSIFLDISFRPVTPASRTYYPAGKIKEDEIIFPDKRWGKNERNSKIAEEIEVSYNNLKGNADGLLVLLRKYASFIPVNDSSPVSLYEHIKFLDAVHQCNDSYLIASAEFSGIQDFIYTISSKGALKSVRARSFFLSLLSEHIVYEILSKEGLNRSAVVFSGGGSFCLLLPGDAEKTLKGIKQRMNSYFLSGLGGKLYLGLVWSKCSLDDLKPPKFRDKWKELGKLLEEDKYRKFEGNLKDLLDCTMPKQLTNQDECQICHRDDVAVITDKELEGNACPLCRELFHLGDALTDYKYINRWESQPPTDHFLEIPSLGDNAYYWVDKTSAGTSQWVKNSFQPGDGWSMFNADYVTPKDGKTADFEYLAKNSVGKELIGCLRMDVDNLGAIFSERVRADFFSPMTISLLSSSLNLFFTVYMNLICEKGITAPLLIPKDGRVDKGRNVSIIYSGGDDLLIVGAWNELCELSLDIERNFKKYVGDNDDISISGGIFLAHPKFPFYQMASFSKDAEEKAKRNQSECVKEKCCKCADYQNCWFYEPGDVPKCKRKDSGLLFYVPSREARKEQLNDNPRTKGRLQTALRWDEIEDLVIKPLETMYPIFNQPQEKAFSRSFIYKLFSLVDKWERDGKLYLPIMEWIIERLKKTANENKEVGSQIQELYSMVGNTKYMSSLHIPLTWLDLLKREGGE